MCLFSLLQWWVRSDLIRRLSLPLGSKKHHSPFGYSSQLQNKHWEQPNYGQKTSRMSTLGCKGDVKRLSLQTVHPAETSHMTFSTQTGLCSRQTQEKCLYIPVNCEARQQSSRKWLQSTKTSGSCRVVCKLNRFRGVWIQHIHAEFRRNPANEANLMPWIIAPKKSQSWMPMFFFCLFVLFSFWEDKPEESSLIISSGLFACFVRFAIQSCPLKLFKITRLIVVTWKVIHKSLGKHSSFGTGALKILCHLELPGYASHPVRPLEQALLY